MKAITRQPIELEVLKPLNEGLVVSILKNWKVFGFCFYVDDIIMGVGLCMFE